MMDHRSPRTVVVLGGYGNFGARIAAALAHEPDVRLLIAGRDAAKAQKLATKMGGSVRAVRLDHESPDLIARLLELDAFLVIHTAGPFQSQDYAVARACIDAGSQYIDIADGRDYVSRIAELDASAQRAHVLAVSGASSLPALSSAVVDQLAHGLESIESIEHAITSTADPPGLATLRAALGYTGKRFTRWERGAWRHTFGW